MGGVEPRPTRGKECGAGGGRIATPVCALARNDGFWGGAVRGRAAAHMGAALQGVTGGAVQVGGVEPRPYAGQGMRCGGRTDCHASVRTGSQ